VPATHMPASQTSPVTHMLFASHSQDMVPGAQPSVVDSEQPTKLATPKAPESSRMADSGLDLKVERMAEGRLVRVKGRSFGRGSGKFMRLHASAERPTGVKSAAGGYNVRR